MWWHNSSLLVEQRNYNKNDKSCESHTYLLPLLLFDMKCTMGSFDCRLWIGCSSQVTTTWPHTHRRGQIWPRPKNCWTSTGSSVFLPRWEKTYRSFYLWLFCTDFSGILQTSRLLLLVKNVEKESKYHNKSTMTTLKHIYIYVNIHIRIYMYISVYVYIYRERTIVNILENHQRKSVMEVIFDNAPVSGGI